MEIKNGNERFYVATHGGEAELRYKVNGGIMSIYHTFVPDSERGKGIAEMLAMAAFESAKERRLKVKPDCPYIVRFLEKHPDLKKYSV